MVKNAFQHNLTRSNYLKQHIKPHPKPPWGEPRFWVKSKMAAIIKPLIYIYIFLNRYHFRTKHRRATYNMSFRTIFFGDSIFSHLKFLRGQTEFFFKVKVTLICIIRIF